jgi:hypothetical protein
VTEWRAFWVEPLELERAWLRRYSSADSSRSKCPLFDYHDARNLFVDSRPKADTPEWAKPLADDSRWPSRCSCGYTFQPDDERQVFTGRLFQGAPDGKLYAIADMPPGAMWDASWLRRSEVRDLLDEPHTGPDGITLVIKLPDGSEWLIDSECNNCTRTQWVSKNGRLQWGGRTHYCWVRHGDPRTGVVHVDKKGETCSAGGGSIQTSTWHGFLDNGFLTTKRR